MQRMNGSVLAGLLLTALIAAPAAWASLAIYMAPEDLARRSDLVVEGTVIRTGSGYDPDGETLDTYVTLQVETVHRGELEQDRIVLREPGGRYGGLVHHVDAVPVYEPGERVLVFLEPARDGALRTTGMFFGKYVITADGPRGALAARRELEGLGRIVGRAPGRSETVDHADLVAVAATVQRTLRPRRSRARALELVPPEYGRLLWDGVREHDTWTDDPGAGPLHAELDADPPAVSTRFVPLSEDKPSRWYQPDGGQPVTVHVERVGNPLGDGGAAAAEMRRALDAWTAVPESRLVLKMGDDDYDYTSSHAKSPADHYNGINVILFNDPYDDISDPSDCNGVLAIGGYWRSGTLGASVNNVVFYPALQLYVIFNNDMECFLGDPDNLAEVAAHELGHGIGFGHSSAIDAIMRAYASGGRGPRLGDDDRDGAHCHYPHDVSLLSPSGGEQWEAGTIQTIEWNTSPESGPDPGEVDLEFSTDGGQVWQPVASGTANDGSHNWLVPHSTTTDARVRVVRKHRDAYAPQFYPSACSQDASASSFAITPSIVVAGSIPADSGGGLSLRLEPNGWLRLSWDPSCSSDVADHVVYEGNLDSLRSGTWDHAPMTCTAGADLAEYIYPAYGNQYYLVAPRAGAVEGSLGVDSAGLPRPESSSACAPRETDSSCN